MTAASLAIERPRVAAGQLRRIRRALEQERGTRLMQLAELERQVARTAQPPEPGSVLNLLDNARLAVCEIDAALHRIRTGRYGLCTACGEPIAHQRLDALPAVALCLPCPRAHERRRR